MPGAHWSASSAYLASSGTVRDPVPKTQEQKPEVFLASTCSHTHVHLRMYVYLHTHEHTHRDSIKEESQGIQMKRHSGQGVHEYGTGLSVHEWCPGSPELVCLSMSGGLGRRSAVGRSFL